ncbi:YhcN/YlaJ family sporulation lipoprotein [Tumebacillus sp. ITR2]|uniref:YhcN/YlaJ family sporulation lipoprotein n=1 Tax=Tumebacillus amylolyticus TaxID=2801339 RepID=A0ABS1J8S7_9BACL|nr:YhcN/YlaJ family sporulation lipoprotein [Tumebacillus amylolyticus]MBL0386610.1 YhcN/YlaJ family sporulation lipoprotein [Tumebacillus amylolyticus]
MKKSWIALTLAALLVAGTTSGCTVLRTPYEKQKIAENGGQVKKKQEGQGSDQSSGGEDKKQSGGKGESGGDTATTQSKQEKKDKAKIESTPRKQNDPLAILQEKNDDKNPHLLYSQTLSSEVSQLEGIVSSTVLLDEEHNAYVAIYTGEKQKYDRDAPKETNEKLRVQTEGDITKKKQESISKSLRKMDPLVNTVYITDNPSHAESFNRYANQISKGGAGSMNTQALAEHIQDIWK